MASGKYLQNVLVGAAAVVVAGALFAPGYDSSGPVLTAATSFVTGASTAPNDSVLTSASTMSSSNALASETKAAWPMTWRVTSTCVTRNSPPSTLPPPL